MIKKISFPIVLLTLMLFVTTSCEDYLDVNQNVDAPDYIEGYLYLAGITQQYQGMYWDIRATGPLSQMMGSTATYFTLFANHYYGTGRDEGGEIWRVVYWLQGMNLENMINQSIATKEYTLAGIGLAMKAYSWDQLTKYHGELPMKQAYLPGLLSHDYDYQDEIYEQIREWAYQAIEYLEMTDNSSYGAKITANDFIYSGNKDKWKKFAYGVIVRNLASLSNKDDFNTLYAQELIDAAALSFQSIADDATVRVAGGGSVAPQSAYNNFWGTFRANLTTAYFQHEYAVQVFTGTVPQYDELTGNKINSAVVPVNAYYPYELAAKQIITDTNHLIVGRFDPRVTVKLATLDDATYLDMNNAANIKKRRYYGGYSSVRTGPIGTPPTFFGRNSAPAYSGTTHDGKGRWLYRDDAPYILMTYAELKFCLAETYWKLDMKTEALTAFRDGVKADLEFSANYISPGTSGQAVGGDKITKATFQTLASEYAAGPYVDGLAEADFTLSHIMMQKWVALYPWGATEAWVDLRKYHYDIDYTGEYPTYGDGYDLSSVTHKWDTDPLKVYQGFYLPPAQVQGRKVLFNTLNNGSPAYRIRPRYNSEYMWNKPSLGTLVPISGTADNYQTSIPWFAYPGGIPGRN